MSELNKTMAFVAVALVSLIAAWATQPSTAELDVQSLVGEELAKNFTDPAEAKRLRIVEFNEDTATLREFEVAEENGLWVIPSKTGYPADAERQMAEAATSLMGRKILAVAGESAGDHEQFGVIDPLSPKLEAGQKGVGRHVIISDIHDEPLVDVIIGRAVKDAPNQRYVREGGRDVVYVIELDTDRLTTNFENWIEKDLLKLNAWDVKQVEIRDYSAELQPVMTPQGLAIQVAWEPRAEMTLAYDDAESKWTPRLLRAFDKETKEYNEFSLAADEELNADKLNELKNALDDLEIVDVARKPAGLSADLKAGGDFLQDAEARKDLRSLGFAAVPARTGEGQELISSEGEVIATMNNGVEYVLRFGDLRMDTSGTGGEQAADATAAEKAAANDKNVQRYLFVMARFNEDAVPKPELAELPALPDGTEETTDDAAAKTATNEQNDANEQSEANESGGAATSEDAESSDLEKTIAERKRIETDNQRKLDEYKEKLDKGRETVKDLNLRFGDWYFVVSNDTFQKIRLGRNDVIKKKDAKPAEGESASADGASKSAPAAPALPSLPDVGG